MQVNHVLMRIALGIEDGKQGGWGGKTIREGRHEDMGGGGGEDEGITKLKHTHHKGLSQKLHILSTQPAPLDQISNLLPARVFWAGVFWDVHPP